MVLVQGQNMQSWTFYFNPLFLSLLPVLKRIREQCWEQPCNTVTFREQCYLFLLPLGMYEYIPRCAAAMVMPGRLPVTSHRHAVQSGTHIL